MNSERLMDVVFPSRDQSLARVVANLSEPDQGKSADNFVTNEDSFGRVASELERHAPAEGVYLGVGPDQNFTYIARSRPRLALIVDFRRRNALLHFLHKALFALARDRSDYLSRLIARSPRGVSMNPSAVELVASFEGIAFDRARLGAAILEVQSYLEPLGLIADHEWSEIATIHAKLAGPGLNARFLALTMYPTFGRLIGSLDLEGKPAHFLAREDWFQTVRERQLGDRVIPLVGDFAGPLTLAKLGPWLKARELSVSVFYASDVEFFLLRSGRLPAYSANLGHLPWADGAVLIRTSTREIAHPSRVMGDSSTTILRPVAADLEDLKAGRIRSVDDLFR